MTSADPAQQPETQITCVDCGGTAHLISHPPPDVGFQYGDYLVYRCSDCMDRWDLVWEPE